MHYLITFHKPTSPDKLLTQAVRGVGVSGRKSQPSDIAQRWKKLVEANGYVVRSEEKIVESKRRNNK